jgi:hypothetical protein
METQDTKTAYFYYLKTIKGFEQVYLEDYRNIFRTKATVK